MHTAADTYATARGHLEKLAKALQSRNRDTQLLGERRPWLNVSNPRAAGLSETIRCNETDDGWQFAWPWDSEIGAVEDIEAVADTIARVLRAVGE